MCTVSWIHAGDEGYQLLCNRDEKRSRPQASGPMAQERNRVRYIAPRDSACGGTWLSVNELGVTLCLLNGPGPAPTNAVSRGTLVSALADCASAGDLAHRASQARLERFAPFTLLALDAKRGSSVCQWNGAEMRIVKDASHLMPLTSSSFESERVCAHRREAYQSALRLHCGRITAALLFDFHRSHNGAPGPHSTCMHREDAETVSFSWISVSPAHASFFYSPAAPCAWAQGESVRLARAPQ